MKLATLCYLKRNGKTLMMHRNKKRGDVHKGKWNGLGGKMEKGESPEECAAREVYEESGLKIANPVMKGILTFPSFSNGEDWYVFLFTVSEFSGRMKESREGVLKWVEDSELLKLNLWEGDRIFLKKIDGGGFFSGKFVYRGGKLLKWEMNVYE